MRHETERKFRAPDLVRYCNETFGTDYKKAYQIPNQELHRLAYLPAVSTENFRTNSKDYDQYLQNLQILESVKRRSMLGMLWAVRINTPNDFYHYDQYVRELQELKSSKSTFFLLGTLTEAHKKIKDYSQDQEGDFVHKRNPFHKYVMDKPITPISQEMFAHTVTRQEINHDLSIWEQNKETFKLVTIGAARAAGRSFVGRIRRDLGFIDSQVKRLGKQIFNRPVGQLAVEPQYSETV